MKNNSFVFNESIRSRLILVQHEPANLPPETGLVHPLIDVDEFCKAVNKGETYSDRPVVAVRVPSLDFYTFVNPKLPSSLRFINRRAYFYLGNGKVMLVRDSLRESLVQITLEECIKEINTFEGKSGVAVKGILPIVTFSAVAE